MELFSNLLWLSLCLCLFGAARVGLRRKTVLMEARSAMLLTGLLCLVLLPAISMIDDLLARQQEALEPGAQTWRLSMEGSALVADCLFAVAISVTALFGVSDTREAGKQTRPAHVTLTLARWLTRAQRLRPPLTQLS